ncbi:hypothetical protein BM768_003884 [Shigella sonnei]|nr:hypothetical protein [Shigella sonnei]
MKKLSVYSRLSRKAGAKIYPNSSPDVHLHKADRIIPVRQEYAGAAAATAGRIAVEVERQTLRSMTYKRLYPWVLALSVLCLLPPFASMGVDMFHAKQAQAEMQRQQKQQLEEMNRRQQERINRLRSGIY